MSRSEVRVSCQTAKSGANRDFICCSRELQKWLELWSRLYPAGQSNVHYFTLVKVTFLSFSVQKVAGFCDSHLPEATALLWCGSHRNSSAVCVTSPGFLTFMAPPYPVLLYLKWKNKFSLLAWLKIQHPGGWHAAQPATLVYGLLNIGWVKHFHPHQPFMNGTDVWALSSLVETHWLLGTL